MCKARKSKEKEDEFQKTKWQEGHRIDATVDNIQMPYGTRRRLESLGVW
jgi:hypothetical protein